MEGFGEPHQVGQDVSDLGTVGVAVEQVAADSGQAFDEVVFAQRREVSPVDARVGLVDPAAGEGGDVVVQGAKRPGVSGPVGRVERERDGGRAVEQAAAGVRGDGGAGCGGPFVGGSPEVSRTGSTARWPLGASISTEAPSHYPRRSLAGSLIWSRYCGGC